MTRRFQSSQFLPLFLLAALPLCAADAPSQEAAATAPVPPATPAGAEMDKAVALKELLGTTFWKAEGWRRWDRRLWTVPAADGLAAAELHARVERLLAAFERDTGKSLRPGAKRQAILKISTASGPGLSTQKELVRGVVAALVRRGFKKEELLLLDAAERDLREAGFLPPLSRIGDPWLFDGVPVASIDSGAYFDAALAYDGVRLPPLIWDARKGTLRDAHGDPVYKPVAEQVRSYLPYNLTLDADFWINLPVLTQHPRWGVSGSIANASVLAVSNRDRFADSSSNAHKAITEIAATPGQVHNWAFTLAWPHPYQYASGPGFNSRYCADMDEIWLAANPALIDSMALDVINQRREHARLPRLDTPGYLAMWASSEINLGSPSLEGVEKTVAE